MMSNWLLVFGRKGFYLFPCQSLMDAAVGSTAMRSASIGLPTQDRDPLRAAKARGAMMST